MGYTDYTNDVASAVDAKVARQTAQWIDQQRTAFDQDQFTYSAQRATAMAERDGVLNGVQQDTPEYNRIMMEYNLRAQQSYLGDGTGAQLSVMGREDRERLKAMLLGQPGREGPDDANTSFLAVQELEQRFSNPEHMQLALSELGIDRSMAPAFRVMGHQNPEWIRIGVMASGMSVQEQTAYTAELRGVSADVEKVERESLYTELEQDARIRAMFGPQMDDPTQREYIREAMNNIVTSLRATNTTADEFFDHIDKNFQVITIEPSFVRNIDNAEYNWANEFVATVSDMVNPFGDGFAFRVPTADNWNPFQIASQPARVNVMVPKGIPGGISDVDFHAFMNNDVWARTIAHATGLQSADDAGKLFDLAAQGPEALRNAGVSPEETQRLFTALGVQRVDVRDGKMTVVYSREDRSEPSVYGQQMTSREMNRDEFLAFMKTRSEKLIGAMFNHSQIVSYGDGFYLRYDNDGQIMNLPLDTNFLRTMTGEMGSAMRQVARWTEHPFRSAFEEASKPVKEIWNDMILPSLEQNYELGRKLYNIELAGSSLNREVGPLIDMAGRGFGTVFRWATGHSDPNTWKPEDAN